MGSRLLLILATLATLSSVQSKMMSQNEMKTKCMERTGLRFNEIVSVNSRNENCAVDCTTSTGTVQTFYADQNTPCHDEDGYRCVLGKCYEKDAALNLPTGDLYNVEIRIKSAKVRDLDAVLSSGESDTFVNIEVVKGGQPSYNDGELVCHTYTVLDNSEPRWDNFVCNPLPMKKDTLLNFVLWDSDKPVVKPDLLGSASEKIDSLLNRGPVTLRLRNNAEAEANEDFIVVDVRGSRYEA